MGAEKRHVSVLFGVCAVSALFRELIEEEAIAHVCICKSCYHEVNKHLLESMDLPPRTVIGKKSEKTVLVVA